MTLKAICSRAECEQPAEWIIWWRNPAIHPVDRRKAWSACPDHVDFLRDYLTARGFPVEVVPKES